MTSVVSGLRVHVLNNFGRLSQGHTIRLTGEVNSRFLRSHTTTLAPAQARASRNFTTRVRTTTSDDTIDQELRAKFSAFWPQLLSEIFTDPKFEDMPQARTWLNHVMERNVPYGKQERALACINVFNEMEMDEGQRTEEKLCMVIGWGIEIFQAAALIADDIMDESKTRRGVKCWYKETDVGLTAVNDAFLLENLGYFILYKYFEEKSYFNRLLAHNHNIIMKTVMGQSMDTRLSVQFNLDRFTQETYRRIVTYKTSYYSFYGPVATAMIMASITDDAIYDKVRNVTLLMGYLFQVQDDYLDCFGDPTVTGKIGTDIQDGKCTWLIVKALEIAAESQRRSLETSYGKKTVNDEKIVKEIYNDLEIQNHYNTFETKTYGETLKLINVLPDCLPKTSFERILSKIYKRSR